MEESMMSSTYKEALNPSMSVSIMKEDETQSKKLKELEDNKIEYYKNLNLLKELTNEYDEFKLKLDNVRMTAENNRIFMNTGIC